MRAPVVDAGGEDRADEIILAHLGVETFDQGVDHGLVDARFGADAGDGGFATGGGLGPVRHGTVDAKVEGAVGRTHISKIGSGVAEGHDADCPRRPAAALRKLRRKLGVALRNVRPHPSLSQRISEEARRS